MFTLFQAAISNFKKKKSSSKGQAQYTGTLLSIIVFIVFLGYIMAAAQNINLTFVTPLSLAGFVVLMVAAIGVGNTPVLRGVAVAAALVSLFTPIFFDFQRLGLPTEILITVIVPITITFLFLWLESSKS